MMMACQILRKVVRQYHSRARRSRRASDNPCRRPPCPGACPSAACSRDLDQMGGVGRGLAGAALRIGAGDVEIAQRDIAQVMGARDVLQHPFDHELGAAIGRDGLERLVLGHRILLRLAIDGGGRGEDEMLRPRPRPRSRDQAAGLGRVVEIIAERIGDRFRHDDFGGEMDDGVDLVARDAVRRQVLVAEIARRRVRPSRHGPARSRSRDCRARPTCSPASSSSRPCGRRYSRRRR